MDYTGGFENTLLDMAKENQRVREKATGFLLDQSKEEKLFKQNAINNQFQKENAKRQDDYNLKMIDFKNKDAEETLRHNSSIEVMKAKELADAENSNFTNPVYSNGRSWVRDRTTLKWIPIDDGNGIGGGTTTSNKAPTTDGKIPKGYGVSRVDGTLQPENSIGEYDAKKRAEAMKIKKAMEQR